MDIGKVPGLKRIVKIKRAFWDLLVEMEARTRASESAADSIAQDTAVLLEGMEHSVTGQKAMVSDLEAIASRVASIASEHSAQAQAIASRVDSLASEHYAQAEAIASRVDALAAEHSAQAQAIAQMELALKEAIDGYDHRSADRLDALRERLELILAPDADAAKAHAALVTLLDDSRSGLVWRLVTPTTVSETIGADDAELHLCRYLASFVSDRHAIDIGAHRGRYTQALLDQGLTVVAVEPEPHLADELRKMFEGREGAIVREAAVSAAGGSAPLYLAEDKSTSGLFGDSTLFSSLVPRSHVTGLAFNPGPQVATVTVDELRAELGWPSKIGILKVDVEGAELSVLDGLGETRPEVLMCEYWGPDHMLVGDKSSVGAAPLVDRLVPTAFRHWLTVIHDDGGLGFAVNSREVPPASWGNVIFFEDRETFMAAVRWCSASLREHIRTIGGT
jgi:FkbM family methyltransferase